MAEKVIFVTGMFLLLFLVISKANSPTGFLEIHSNPTGATVTIDDVIRGVTPENGSLEVALIPGRHTIVVAKEWYTGYVDIISIERGQTKQLTLDLDKIN